MAYLCQAEALEREVLSQVTLLPHLDEKDRKSMPSVDQVRAEFDAWLAEEPAYMAMTSEDREQQELYRLLGVGKGR